jgi:DNA-directed RNA polymerase specialized sigma subunit
VINVNNVNEPAGPEPPEPDLRLDNGPVVVEDDDLEYVAARRGRPRKLQSKEQLAQVLKLYFVEKLSMRRVAEVLGVSHMSVYRMLSDPNLELLI